MESDIWREMPFDQAVLVNPSVPLAKGKIYPFVDMQSVMPFARNVGPSEIREYSGGGARFQDGDTLMARITPSLENGKISRFSANETGIYGHGSTEFIVIRGRSGVSTNDYAYYLTIWDEVRQYAISQMTGSSGRQRVPTNALSNIRIPLPPLPEQRAIAAVLGALDDKIELNRRMNGTLEAMARALFKSWFVDFDPVRAKMAGRPAGLPAEIEALFPDGMEMGEDGVERPRGWGVGTLGDIIEIHDSKRIPLSRREREKRRGIYPYYGAASIMDYIDDYLFDGRYVLMGEDGSVINEDGTPVLQYVWGKFWVNNHAHVLTGTSAISVEHLLLILEQINLNPYVTGAVQLKLSQGNLKKVPLIIPSNPVSISYGKVIESFYARLRCNSNENIHLTALRDVLLPKLMSGEVRVSKVSLAHRELV